MDVTEALQKVTREVKAMSADKYDVTAQGEDKKWDSFVGVSSSTQLKSSLLEIPT